MSFIEKIQNQPRRKRLIILWVSTSAVMLIIAAIWLFSFSRTLEKINVPKEATNSEKNQESNLPSLFESLKRDFSDLKDMFRAGVKDIDTKVQDAQNLQNTNNLQTNGEEGQGQ